MSRDVIIDWCKEKPNLYTIEMVVRGYFGETAKTIEWSYDRWYVTLHGRLSFPFLHVGPATPAQRAYWAELMHPCGARGIEVWPSKDGEVLYVMTRATDPLTRDLSDAFAELLANAFDGRIRPS